MGFKHWRVFSGSNKLCLECNCPSTKWPVFVFMRIECCLCIPVQWGRLNTMIKLRCPECWQVSSGKCSRRSQQCAHLSGKLQNDITEGMIFQQSSEGWVGNCQTSKVECDISGIMYNKEVPNTKRADWATAWSLSCPRKEYRLQPVKLERHQDSQWLCYKYVQSF